MALLAVYQPDPLSLAHVTAALGDQHDVVPFPSWSALRDALDRTPADGCLIDPYHPSGPVDLSEIHQLRQRHGALAIIVYADFAGREMDLYTLGRFQIDGVLPIDERRSLRQIRGAVTEALTSSLAVRVVESLRKHLSQLGLDCLRWAIENSHKEASVEQLAELFARSPASLSRTLRQSGTPSAARLLLWGRLLRATHMLSVRGSTVEGVAYAVGYSSGAALARALSRETGYSPREVLRRGGIGCVLDGFVRTEVRGAPARGAGRWRVSPSGAPRRPRSGF